MACRFCQTLLNTPIGAVMDKILFPGSSSGAGSIRLEGINVASKPVADLGCGKGVGLGTSVISFCPVASSGEEKAITGVLVMIVRGPISIPGAIS